MGSRGKFPTLAHHLMAIADDECVFDNADVAAVRAAAGRLVELEDAIRTHRGDGSWVAGRGVPYETHLAERDRRLWAALDQEGPV